jgi:RNA polymerase sigma-70 factor (sigma-E family)
VVQAVAALDDALPRVAAQRFEDHYPGLFQDAYRVAYRLLGDRAEAEDTAQEACARAYARWSGIRDYARPWCVRVASNVALDRLRAAERARRRTPHHDRQSPGDEMLITNLRLDLYRALKELPSRQQQVVILRYLGDVSEHETANVLGISTGAVKTHASRGLARLREAMGP